jgi:glycosyltransferase involved in cell wall biosynthesis
MRLHILAVPYTITRDEYSHDAFTNRVKNFSPMMRARGFEVYHYGVETSESGATKNFDLMTKAEWTSLRIASLRWLDPTLTYENAVKKNEDPTMIVNNLSNWSSPLTKEFNVRLRKALLEQYRDKTTDIVCVPLRETHDEALNNLNVTAMEIGIGYGGSCKDYRIFDSYSWMSYTLGIEKKVPFNYWFVIPHPYDISQFKVSLTPNPRRIGYMGRLVSDKGCGIIVEVAKRMPHLEFILCGQGDPAPFLKAPNVKYKAPIHGGERSEYLGSCVAVLTPTKYLEPFGCVMVEAQLCGTPVICSDWGGMAETVEQFKTGLRCHTLADYCHGIQMAIDGKFDRNYIRERAANLYDMTILGRQYEYAFKSVLDLFNSEKNGWYSPESHISAMTLGV